MTQNRREPPISRALIISALLAACICAGFDLLWRLSVFPGLHGDEAWLGLDALDIARHGLISLNGMNHYTGSLFPGIVAAFFSAAGASVFTLRLPGVLFNLASLAILAFSFRHRIRTALLLTALLASSPLFLLYGRVAWEVCALQNFLLALIIAALNSLWRGERLTAAPLVILYTAFAAGLWNHFIFSAASISFAIASAAMLLWHPDRKAARVTLAAFVNLAVQAAVAGGKLAMPGGVWVSLAAIACAGFLIWFATAFTVAAEMRGSEQLVRFARKAASNRAMPHLAAIGGIAVCAAAIYEGPSFFGAVSGILPMERVASWRPTPWIAAALEMRAAILVLAGIAALSGLFRQTRAANLSGPFFLLWTVAFFAVLALETFSVPDRYFIIPQLLFLAGIALSTDVLARWQRRLLHAVILVSVIPVQLLVFREVARTEARQPFEFRYVFYEDTTRHFTRLDALQTWLASHGICRRQSSSYFIREPLQFLSATGGCTGAAAATVEYCDSCQQPVPGFAVRPARGDVSAN